MAPNLKQTFGIKWHILVACEFERLGVNVRIIMGSVTLISRSLS